MAGGPCRARQLEAGQARRNEEIRKRRFDLPWVAVGKDYHFDIEDAKKSLAGLFKGRSQLADTCTAMAPDPFVAPYHSFLLERTPKEGPGGARLWRKDEYPN